MLDIARGSIHGPAAGNRGLPARGRRRDPPRRR